MKTASSCTKRRGPLGEEERILRKGKKKKKNRRTCGSWRVLYGRADQMKSVIFRKESEGKKHRNKSLGYGTPPGEGLKINAIKKRIRGRK